MIIFSSLSRVESPNTAVNPFLKSKLIPILEQFIKDKSLLTNSRTEKSGFADNKFALRYWIRRTLVIFDAHIEADDVTKLEDQVILVA